MRALHKLIVTVAGAGYSPIAPGTMGSIVAFIVYLLAFNEETSPVLFLGITIVICIIGTLSTYYVEKEWEHDSSKVVIDEFVGLWISLAFVPFSITNAALALLLFRFFDILKPFGIRAIDEKMGGAAGVILDDVLAGVYANIVLQIIVWQVIPMFSK